METYWSEIEYHYERKHPASGEVKGGFVYAFVKASDSREALRRFAAAIAAEHLAIDRVIYVSPYGSTSWQKEEDERKYTRLVEAAQSGSEVVFDEFYSFQNE